MALQRRRRAAFLIRPVALAATILFVALATPAGAGAHPGRAYWSSSFLIDRLNNRHLEVAQRVVVLRADTLTCSGEGMGVVRRRARMWKHFRCIQPTFPPGALVGPDALFRVHVGAARRYVITN